MEQDAYWAYHDTLFANQAGENQGAFAEDRLIRMAEELDMDVDAFEDCLDSEKYRDEIMDETQQGQADGINATPTFIINGTRVEGVSNYESFRQVIEDALREAGV